MVQVTVVSVCRNVMSVALAMLIFLMSVCVGTTENAEDEVIRLKIFLLERKLIFVCVSVLPLLKL